MNLEKIGFHQSWQPHLGDEFDTEYMKTLNAFLQKERKDQVIFPKQTELFSAFNLTSFDDVKVVIIGQDPYHGPNQAHGLSFSVKPGVPTPPSLKNIYKELNRDLGMEIPGHGYLADWAKQGVLLLNSVLTVRQAQAASHQKKGWETFTDKVVEVLAEGRSNIVFLLWGNYAKKKGQKIDRNKHLVLESGHPSPLSVRFFLGCGHFSQTNQYLEKTAQTPINWHLPLHVQ